MVEEDRVAVRRGTGHPGGRYGVTGTGYIFDDQLSLECFAHGLGQQSGGRVSRAAGREGHDEGNRFCRVLLRQGLRPNKRKQRSLLARLICRSPIQSNRHFPKRSLGKR